MGERRRMERAELLWKISDHQSMFGEAWVYRDR